MMKKIMIIACITCLGFGIKAQTSGKIVFEEVQQLDIDLEEIAEAGGIDIETLKQMMPTENRSSKQLIFNGSESVYQDYEKMDTGKGVDLTSGNVRVKVQVMGGNDVEEITYYNNETQSLIKQKGLLGKVFLVKGKTEQSKWKLTGEKIIYLDHECHKAVLESEDGSVIAWFAPSIPAKVGPASYNGLPGTILMISADEGDLEIKATEISLSKVDEGTIKAPTKGKEISSEDFEKVVEEKRKEMEMNNGGNVIIRRGPGQN